jgi:hypothetical protein
MRLDIKFKVGDLWLLLPRQNQSAKTPAEALLLNFSAGLFCWRKGSKR